MNKIITTNDRETYQAGVNLAKSLKKGDIVFLSGQLGNGKTTFVQGMAKGLGIEKRIISPTFILMRSYRLETGSFFHVDLYRVSYPLDEKSIGLDEVMSGDSIVALEWPERLRKLPGKRIDVQINYLDDSKREILISKHE